MTASVPIRASLKSLSTSWAGPYMTTPIRRIIGWTLIVAGIAGGLFLGAYPLVAETGDIPDSIIALSVFVGAAVGAIVALVGYLIVPRRRKGGIQAHPDPDDPLN